MPRAPWHNAVLKTRKERNSAIRQVKKLGLPLVAALAKNWDSLAALDCILEHVPRSGRVLDAGAELYSQILPWLSRYGYEDLEGINLIFDKPRKVGTITYRYGDITRTDYPPSTFDAVTCLSVVEHGVHLPAYFEEMSRILKPGGLLVTSTDYWQTPIDTRGQSWNGVPVRIFTEREILSAIEIAKGTGLAMTGPLDLACVDRTVHWSEVNLDYTFAVFTMRKIRDPN